MTSIAPLSRRSLLKATASGVAAAGLSAAPFLTGVRQARAAEPINFATWSAAVDTVKSHLAAFEAKTGIKVNYSNSPWAQYRETMITRFIGKAPIDVLWVSDSWLPEWADAGWIVPVDQFKSLTDNSDVDQFCVDSMTYNGKQYGNAYYSDYMAFIYNANMLATQGAAGELGRGDRAEQGHQRQGARAMAASIVNGPGELVDRVHDRDGLLERRPLYRRQGQCGHAGSGEWRRARAALVGRCRAQTRLPGRR